MTLDDTATIYLLDHDLSRFELLQKKLQSHGYQVAKLASQRDSGGREAFQRPCVLLIDLASAQRTHWFQESGKPTSRSGPPVLLLADSCSTEDVLQAMEWGVVSMQLRPLDDKKLMQLIEAILKKEFVNSSITKKYLKMREVMELMTGRQRSILSMVAEGKTTKEIALALDFSVRLVEQERSTILRQFEVQSTPEVAVKIGEYRALRWMNAGAISSSVDTDDMENFLRKF